MPLGLRVLRRGAKRLGLAAKGWYPEARLIRDLQGLGVRPSGTLMVHSSLSSLGYVPGGPATVVSALRAAIGPSGTLVMPTHSWDRSGSGDFRFDIRATPSCVGAITEAFRRMPGVVRSLHPTHSVAAVGPRAHHLVEGHQDASTPCGSGTPYVKLLEEPCQVLFLGATLDENTLFHTVEAVAAVPYLMREADESFTVTDAAGATSTMSFRRHLRGPDRRFSATTDDLERAGILRRGWVGASTSLLVEAAPMLEWSLDRVRANARFLVA